jgi:thiamine biosynthesis lipoprotein
VASDDLLEYTIDRTESCWRVSYQAMSTPCTILLRCANKSEVDQAASLAFLETRRIERKFSRYRDDSVVAQINQSNGCPVAIDEETSRLLLYSSECHELSGGLFDISSGVLRKAWTFDGRTVVPDNGLIDLLRSRVGWSRVSLTATEITLPSGMEIDLGGVAKEYAVDRVAEMIHKQLPMPILVNMGGDIRAIGTGAESEAWRIGMECPDTDEGVTGEIELRNGAVATSGDARRYCIVDGRRLGHILDPRTGWPVCDAPQSVTVVSATCSEAGFLSTLAILQGLQAETFLKAQGVQFHCVR